MDFLSDYTLNHWFWFISAVLLLVLELMAPGVVFLWVGFAAAVTGLIVLALSNMGWETQLLVFSVLSIISVILGRNFVRDHTDQAEETTLNRRAEQYVGQTFEVIIAISGGQGKIKVGDGEWLAKGEDADVGARVRVVKADGAELYVEATE